VPGRFLFNMVLALIPSIGAFAGGWLDERAHLGFTNWRSACRGAGLSPRSLLHFTQELLPAAIVGVLIGGLVLLCVGVALRFRPVAVRDCAATHLGCALAMPLGLVLCTISLPVGAVFTIDVVLAACAAALAVRWLPLPVNRVTPHP
jgi:hypothetical protein